MRNTVQRKIILDIVKQMHSHPTVETVYQEVQKEYPSISKATVYRNLHQLAESGEIRAVILTDSPERFDDRLSRHYHFRCKACDTIFDVDMEYLSGINEIVQNHYGFQVDEHDVIFQGVCSECKAQEGV